MATIGNAPVFPTQSVLPGNLQVTGNATISGSSATVNGNEVRTVGTSGAILQVVSVASETETTVSSTSYTDIGLSASITPSSSTNKVLVLVSAVGRWTNSSSSNTGGGSRILRDSTAIHTAQQNSGSTPLEERFQFNGSTTGLFWTRLNVHVLDSPASTSSLTYKVQAAMHTTTGSGNVTFQQNSSISNSTSYITLMELVA